MRGRRRGRAPSSAQAKTGLSVVRAWRKETKTDALFEYALKLHGTSNEALKELIDYTEVKHFEEVVPSLEEIFFNVVKGENHA